MNPAALISTLVFATAGISTLFIINSEISLQGLLQVMSIVILVIVFLTRFVFSRIATKNRTVAYLIEAFAISIFLYVLVFSTGSLASPFLILTHLYAIGVAFLISPQITTSFVFVTVVFLILSLRSDESAALLLEENRFSIILYFLAYVAILPFTNFLARLYRQKEAWVQELSQMLATSKKQEESLLKNIEDAVLVVSRDLEVSYANKGAQEKTGYSEKDLVGKKFLELFNFKDNSGNNISGENLPLAAVITTKNEAQLEGIQISDKSGAFRRANLKILPVIDHTGVVLGVMIIIKDFSDKDLTLSSYFEKVAEEIPKIDPQKLKNIAQDLLLMLKLESEAQEGLSSFINVATIVENEMFALEPMANTKKVRITCESPALETTRPRGTVISPQKKCSFPNVFILASEDLLQKAMNKLIQIAVMTAENGTEMRVDITTATDVVKIEVLVSNSKVTQVVLDLLHVKFFNKSSNMDEFKDTTGLEIAIAETIFEKHGGDLKIEKTGKGVQFTATLIRPEIKTSPAEKS